MNNFIVLEKYLEINYCVVFNPQRKEYIACWCPNFNESGELTSWGQGHYFYDIVDCANYIQEKLNKR